MFKRFSRNKKIIDFFLVLVLIVAVVLFVLFLIGEINSRWCRVGGEREPYRALRQEEKAGKEVTRWGVTLESVWGGKPTARHCWSIPECAQELSHCLEATYLSLQQELSSPELKVFLEIVLQAHHLGTVLHEYCLSVSHLLSSGKPHYLIALGRDWSGTLAGGGGAGHWKKA